MEITATTEDKDSDEEVGNLKDSYPYYGDGSGRSEPMTIRSVRMRDTAEAEAEMASSNSVPKDSKKKGLFSQPQGTMEYTVKSTDKLASIALSHDSTLSQLMRLNHLSSSMIFPGQKLYVPDPDSTEPVVLSPTNKSFPSQPVNTFSTASSRVDIPTISMKPKKPPDVPLVKPAPERSKKNRIFTRSKSKEEDGHGGRERKQKYRKKGTVKKQMSTPIPGRVIRQGSQEPDDNDENSKQFLKLEVKYITDGEGVVSGTMLVTPNAIMFDPNVSDPLVIERGVGSYGVITQMDIVVGASMYRDISAMSLKADAESSKTCPVYIPGEKETLSETKEASNEIPPQDNGITPQTNGITDPNSEGKAMQDEVQDTSDNREKTEKSNEKSETEKGTLNDDSGINGEVNTEEDLLLGSSEWSKGDLGRGSGPEDVNMGEMVLDEAVKRRLSDREDKDEGGSEGEKNEPEEVKKYPSDVEMHSGGEKESEASQTVQLVVGREDMDNRDDERINEREDQDRVEEVGKGVQENGEDDTTALHGSSSDSSPSTEASTKQERPEISLDLAKPDEVNSAMDDQAEKQDSEVPEKELSPSDDISATPVAEPSNIPATDNNQSNQETTAAKESESNQAFVNFSSGLFVTDKRKCSMVQDMSECIVTDEGIFERKLQEVEEGGKELRRLSELELVKEKETWLDDKIAEEKLLKGETLPSDEVTSIKQEDVRERSASLGSTVKLVYVSENFEEFRPRPAQRYEDPPLYLCLKVYRPMQKTFEAHTEEEGSGENNSKRKTQKSHKLPEYWFAIPREKADNLYNFFLQWSPEKYGKEVSHADLGFVPVEQSEPMIEVVEDFFTEPISKDWEIVSKEEANRRRMTLLECEMDLPLPQLLGESRLLDTSHIGKLRKELPPRTEGYNWSMIYNTASDGFSLQSLYRTMQDWECPVLLLLEDSSDYLFGALVSCPLKESDAYYGTGETFLFQFQPGEDLTDLVCYRWTGENMYFIKGDKDSISIGGGEYAATACGNAIIERHKEVLLETFKRRLPTARGHQIWGTIGLWLDGDLYHGRCRRCKTFDNAILSGTEDFVIKNLEVWGFVM